MKYQVLIIGPSLEDHGGISKVEKNIITNWPDCNYVLNNLVTHEDGSSFKKIIIFLKSIFSYIKHIAINKPHLIHVHFSINASILRKSFFVVTAKTLNVKILLHSHTGEMERILKSSSWIYKKYIIFILNLADGLIVLGSRDINVYAKYIRNYTPVVLKNGVEIQERQTDLTSKQIISVGSLGVRKGTYDLLEAIPKVLESYPDAIFILVGDGEVETVNNIIKKNDLIENVRVPGWLNFNQVKEIYLSSSIFVLPSHYEGMPMSILEAMSFGLPVISTDINGIPDIILDGETGLIIEPSKINELSSAIIKLLQNYQYRLILGSNGKKRIDTLFTLSEMKKNLIKIYDNILNTAEHK